MAKGRREAPKAKRKKWKTVVALLCVFLVLFSAIYLFLVYTNNAFIAKWRTIYIETAMTTMRHKWLATAFIPADVIDSVMDQMVERNEEQSKANSTWNTNTEAIGEELKGETPESIRTEEIIPNDTSEVDENDEENLFDDSMASDEEERVQKEQRESPEEIAARQAAEEEAARNAFYETYSELDRDSFELFLTEHSEYFNGDYNEIVIEDLEGKLGLKSVFDETILVLDVPNNLILLGLSGSDYVGKLAIVKNPEQVYLEPAINLGFTSMGTTIEGFAEEYHALIAMNGSGFDDPNGEGWGGSVVGTYIAHNLSYTNCVVDSYKTFGFRKDYRMYIENQDTFYWANYIWAMQFSPALIVDGELVVEGSYGYGLQPRSAVGQSADGSFMMLAIDGRQVGYSIGLTVSDCAEILLKHGAYQAMNLDGGSSTVMAYAGKLITKPSSVTSFGRYLPNAFVIHYADEIPNYD